MQPRGLAALTFLGGYRGHALKASTGFIPNDERQGRAWRRLAGNLLVHELVNALRHACVLKGKV
jgi:hypothetical protein